MEIVTRGKAENFEVKRFINLILFATWRSDFRKFKPLVPEPDSLGNVMRIGSEALREIPSGILDTTLCTEEYEAF